MSESRRRTTPIDKSEVRSVYTGRVGKCCCGCAGNHRYASASREASGKRRGYPIQDDEVSDRSVSIVVNKINQRIAEGGVVMEGDGLGQGSLFSFETESRQIIAYCY
jgi:hypothetical protein